MTSNAQIVQRERQILRVICQGFDDGPVDESARYKFKNYPWLEAEHQAIFQALRALPAGPPEIIFEQLPARLTRLGFPDAAWEDLFQPHGLTRTEAEQLIQQLLKTD